MDKPKKDTRGSLVRPFAVTRGRTTPASHIAMEAILTTTTAGIQEAPFAGHHKQLIAAWCQAPTSLAELSAHLAIPLGVAAVIVADMVSEKMLTLHTPADPTEGYDERMHMLERVLDGLRKL